MTSLPLRNANAYKYAYFLSPPAFTMKSYAQFRRYARVVNRMMSMTASSRLCLEDIVKKLPTNARYSPARPCRIYWRFEDRIPVQLFPKGTVQVLGRYATFTTCEKIRNFLETHLLLSLSPPCLNSCTVSCRIAPHLACLTKLPSNHHISNDYELFPGTLIRYSSQPNRRVHLCFFSNGTCIVTGVLSRRDAYRQVTHCIKAFNLF